MSLHEHYLTLVSGGIWGVLQGLFVWSLPVGAEVGDMYWSAVLAFTILITIGIAAMVGFILDDFRAAIYCLFLAQAISAVFLLTSAQNSVILVGLGAFLFIVGLVFGVGGAALREWFYLRPQFSMRWALLLIAILTQSFIVVISISLLQSLQINWLSFSENLYLQWATPILLAVGIIAALAGLVARGRTSQLVAGGLIIAALVFSGLTLISIDFIGQVLPIMMNSTGPDQVQLVAQFQLVLWCLYSSLLIPGLVLLRIALAREDTSLSANLLAKRQLLQLYRILVRERREV